MIQYNLPKEIVLSGGIRAAIRSDYRPILDICAAIQDPRLSEREKLGAALQIFYIDAVPINEEAINRVFWFIDGGDAKGSEPQNSKPKLIDWEQDFPLIVAPINSMIGQDIRGLDYLHWWTFLSYFQEIGECTFSHVLSIRDKRAKKKRLDDAEREFYKAHRNLVDFQNVEKPKPSPLLQKLLGMDTEGGEN